MSEIIWSQDFSVGFPKIDEQHQKLISLLNDLNHSYLTEGTNRKQLGVAIETLLDYTKFHFSTEEYLMRQLKYPDYDAHIQEHKNFVEKVSGFYKDFLDNKASLSKELINFLNDWVQNHIIKKDKLYAALIKKK